MLEFRVHADNQGARVLAPMSWCAALLLVALTGCDGVQADSLHAGLQSLGAEDPPVPSAQTYKVLCDPSEESPCEHGAATLLVERVTRAAFARPGSRIEVWVQGPTVAETRLVGSILVPTREERGARTERAAEERFLASVRTTLCRPLGAALTRPRPRRSPLAASLDKLALAGGHGLPVRMYVLSDLREVAGLDFECRRLPSDPAFAAYLSESGLLQPGTFNESEVHFIVGDRGPVRRRGCPVTMWRERRLQTLWATALRHAGAQVDFATEVPELNAPATGDTTNTRRTP